MRWLAICGSLRRQSSNLSLLRAAMQLAPEHVTVSLYGRLGALPPFNPDLEARLPAAVKHWRAAIAAADGLLISSPEYAHGVSGVLKNALDWLVAGPEFVGKPLALLNATTRAEFAPAQLAETLRTMSGVVIDSAGLSLPLLGGAPGSDAIVAEPTFAEPLRAALERFAAAVAGR